MGQTGWTREEVLNRSGGEGGYQRGTRGCVISWIKPLEAPEEALPRLPPPDKASFKG